MMTSRELVRWSHLHERRGRSVPPLVIPLVIGAALAGWVWWRGQDGVVAASHAWLAGAILAYAVAFMRVPFHIYWRADAALLAQLPIEGRPLFDAALARCMRSAEATTIAALVGIAPLALAPLALAPLALGATGELDAQALALRHAAVAVALGAVAAALLPAVTVGAAALVVQGSAATALRTATALAGAPARAVASDGSSTIPSAAPPTQNPSAVLGALPGFAATLVIAAIIVIAPWLVGRPTDVPAHILLPAIVAISVVALVGARAGAGVMARVLRDVSAIDRQRLATLEIKPITALERAIAALAGSGALAYDRDARLMRRRFPMAYALGALIFGVLVLVGIVRPADPTPWLTVAIAGGASYGLVLASRLRRPPIELARLSATLPLTPAANARAKLAWLLGWWTIFIGAPAVFAAVRQSAPAIGLALVGAATLFIIVAGAWRR